MPKNRQRAGMDARARATRSREYKSLVKSLAARVVALREAAGLTQEAASHAAGVDLRTWQRLEGAEVVQPTMLTIFKVASVLGVEPWEMLRPN